MYVGDGAFMDDGTQWTPIWWQRHQGAARLAALTDDYSEEELFLIYHMESGGGGGDAESPHPLVERDDSEEAKEERKRASEEIHRRVVESIFPADSNKVEIVARAQKFKSEDDSSKLAWPKRSTFVSKSGRPGPPLCRWLKNGGVR